MEPRVGEYVWMDSDSIEQIPAVFSEPLKLQTVKVAIFQGLLVIVLMIVATVFKIDQVTLDGPCSNLAVLLFIQGALWTISFILHHYYCRSHYNLRIFSTNFDERSSAILFIFSIWNTFTVIYLAASIKYASSSVCDYECSYSALNLTIYSIWILGFLLMAAIKRYARAVMDFNFWSPAPVSIIAQALSMSRNSHEDAIRSRDDQMRRFITHQSFLIEFYKTVLDELIRSRAQEVPDNVLVYPNGI